MSENENGSNAVEIRRRYDSVLGDRWQLWVCDQLVDEFRCRDQAVRMGKLPRFQTPFFTNGR